MARPEGFGDNQSRHFKQLYDAAAFPLTSVGGTADDVTATLDPVLDSGGLVDGMKFSLTWDADNAGPMTLALNGGPPADILGADGSVMIAGAAKAGSRALLEYISGAFRIIGGGNSGGAVGPYFTQITASTTWNKPSGYADDAMVLLEGWGGGGGGARNNGAGVTGGGGGGGYAMTWVRYAELPSSLSITIGAGGAGGTGGAGGGGGNTTIGSLLTAFGGGGGSTTSGGGGGGEISAGSGATAGRIGGGAAASDAKTAWGGGGGGHSSGGTPVKGGDGVFGGGGGCGVYTTGYSNGGTSLFGGDGGGGSFTGVAGSAPGGGGGAAYNNNGGAGARGEVRITIFG